MTNTELKLWRRTLEFHRELADRFANVLSQRKSSYLFVCRADALAYIGRIDDAIKILKNGLAEHPHYRAAQILLAELYYDKGDIAAAYEILGPTLEKWPDVTAGVSLMCRIHAKLGNYESACRLADELLAINPDSTFVAQMAHRYRRAWEKERRKGLEMAVCLTPDSPAVEGRGPALPSTEGNEGLVKARSVVRDESRTSSSSAPSPQTHSPASPPHGKSKRRGQTISTTAAQVPLPGVAMMDAFPLFPATPPMLLETDFEAAAFVAIDTASSENDAAALQTMLDRIASMKQEPTPGSR
jgi:tetratricopeptide (TPR) repeat protein